MDYQSGAEIGAGPGATAGRHANRLGKEKSPYLLQHANNPVNWYPWGKEAFSKAQNEQKPIFLSIGYSTCHWCHVMEKETFENAEAARLMNDTFVSIKVDREERPDIDHIYMSVCQMMTGSGGWPLNVILTPDRKPFFAATYIPRETRFGRVGMIELTQRIKELWSVRRDEVLRSSENVLAALRQLPDDMPGETLGANVLDAARNQLAERFDKEHGGFGAAPKFPTPHNMLFLLRRWKSHGDSEALQMVEKTLDAMRMGGVYDHVGFGFHRYSTDAEWLLPHFEKMLYDQALLAMVYTEAYQATGKDDYARMAKEIFEYVLRDMTSPEGGFYSAEDADSEGVEGKFYVWTNEELRDALGDEDAALVAKVYNVKPGGNFVDEATGQATGSNILHLTKSVPELAEEMGMPADELERRLEAARKKLFAVRERRIHPHKDDKILTDWNGLMISALAKGAQVFDEPRYSDAASKAAEFTLGKMRHGDKGLLHRFRDGHAGIPGLVDDYAFFIWGLLDLYEATFKAPYLQSAIDLNQYFMAEFWDDKAGGFYFTPKDGEDLIVRKKEIYDGATPSGNSVAAFNLLRLARLTGDTELERRSSTLFRAFAGNVNQFPSAYTQLLVALEFSMGPTYEVVIAGRPATDDTKAMLQALRRAYIPNKVVLLRPTASDEAAAIERIAEFTKRQDSLDGKATAYVCRDFNCKFPTTDADKMLELLSEKNQ